MPAGVVAAVIGAGASIGGGAIAARSAGNAADKQSAAAKEAAAIQEAANRRAEEFARQQAQYTWSSAETDRRANYDQNAARERRISSLGETLGYGGREIPDYVPSQNPGFYGLSQAQPQQTGGNDAAFQSGFQQLIAGKPPTPDALVALEGDITRLGGKVLRNASGVAGKVQTPSGQIVDVIEAAGAGGKAWQWLTGPGPSAGRAQAPLAAPQSSLGAMLGSKSRPLTPALSQPSGGPGWGTLAGIGAGAAASYRPLASLGSRLAGGQGRNYGMATVPDEYPGTGRLDPERRMPWDELLDFDDEGYPIGQYKVDLYNEYLKSIGGGKAAPFNNVTEWFSRQGQAPPRRFGAE